MRIVVVMFLSHWLQKPRFLRKLQWSPTTVSWVGFLVFSLVVLAIGLWGSQRIARLLEQEMILHGVDHNRAVFARILPPLQALLNRHSVPAEALADFARTFAAAETLSMSLFLVDRRENRILARSGHERPASGQPLITPSAQPPRLLLPQEDPYQGVALARRAPQGTQLLWYRAPLPEDFPAYARHWDLVVETEMVDVAKTSALMQGRVKWLLLITDLLIILLGFFALRRVGRFYEQTLEAQLAARTAELEASHREMLRQTTLAAIGQTTSILAHEMRNPLAAIKLSLSSLHQADYLRARDRRRVDLVLRETDRLNDLLDQTLDQVRPIRRSKQPVPVNALLTQVAELLLPVAERNRQRIQVQPCLHCPPLRVDADQLQQALLNLLKNALAFSAPGETIQLAAAPWDSGWQLQVCNPGEPIPESQRERIFDAFFSTRPKGTGLGLFLVKRVAMEHGGAVTLRQDGKRICFILRIPREAAPCPSTADRPLATPPG